MPGADKMIGEFRGRGISTVLVTGSGQHSLLDRLERDYPGAFPADLRITSHDVFHGKPHPEPYLKAMQRVDVTPECSIAVDNAPMGVISGAESGAFTIGVTTGPIPEKELVDAGADIVYSSMPELAQHLLLLLDAFAEVKL
jgi:HAD superfamily hydrolase (TIGR01509 family)